MNGVVSRSVWCLLVGLGLLLVGTASAGADDKNAAPAQDANEGRTSAAELKLSPPLKIEATDDAEKRLEKERFNAALRCVAREEAHFRQGKSALDALLEPLERLARSAEPVLDGEAYVALLSQCVDVAKQVEEGTKVKTEHGIAAVGALDEATYVRADLELRLLKARRVKGK